MCAISVVIDAAMTQFPPVNQWPLPQVTDMTEVVRLLKAIDDKLGTKDCVDAKKDAFLKELADRLAVLEAQPRG